jgi:hypothetical protein
MFCRCRRFWRRAIQLNSKLYDFRIFNSEIIHTDLQAAAVRFSHVLTVRSAAGPKRSVRLFSAAVTVRMVSEIMGSFRDKITEAAAEAPGVSIAPGKYDGRNRGTARRAAALCLRANMRSGNPRPCQASRNCHENNVSETDHGDFPGHKSALIRRAACAPVHTMRSAKIFYTNSNGLRAFPLLFIYSPALSETGISMCSTSVCG